MSLDIDKLYKEVPCGILKSFAELLYNTAKGCSKGIILEIGSNMGCSTISLASGSRDGHKVKMVSIDPHNGGTATPTEFPTDEKDFRPQKPNYIKQGLNLDKFKLNLINFNVFDCVTIICDYSELAFDKWEKEPIELLFIDADHRYYFVKKDVELYFPYVIRGGYVIFDDYAYPGVTRIINELLNENKIKPIKPNFGMFEKL